VNFSSCAGINGWEQALLKRPILLGFGRQTKTKEEKTLVSFYKPNNESTVL